MFGKRFRRRSEQRNPSTGSQLVYAVGDVHGRADLLNRLVSSLLADAEKAGIRPTLVFLGDYVDRGPQSRQVIELLIALQDQQAIPVHTLRGNHDQSLLRFLDDVTFGPTWLRLGGAATMASYGVTAPGPQSPAEEWAATHAAFVQAFPARHKIFFETLELYCIVGDYLFVHAGVKPGVPLEQQTPEDMMWIRDEFLSAHRPSDKVVVHGHTPASDPHLSDDRIGLDTGAYATGVLTAVRLHETAQNIIQSKTERGT